MKTLVLLASIALAPAAIADEVTSTTPYATLYQVLSPVAKIDDYDHLVAIERIESKDAERARRDDQHRHPREDRVRSRAGRRRAAK